VVVEIADESPTAQHSVRYGRSSFQFTMASVVITVNCVLGGATIGLLCDGLLGRFRRPSAR
jgi:hypothetical protein